MALGFVILGIIAGGIAATLVLASGAGFLAALGAYAGGGMAGLAGGVLLALRPRQDPMAALPQTE